MEDFEARASMDAHAAADLAGAQSAAVGHLLEDQRPANLVGVGIGVKWTAGAPTGDPAVLLLVAQKLPEDALRPADRLPAEVADTVTDVVAIGRPVAGEGPIPPAGVQALTIRLRPAKSGSSVGHRNITAGTIGTCVYDQLPGAARVPPAPGIGKPRDYYILSNNHVLANSNAGRVGDPVLQPGPADGGRLPQDQIGELARFVPIDLDRRLPPGRAQQCRGRGACSCALRGHRSRDLLGWQATCLAPALRRPRRRGLSRRPGAPRAGRSVASSRFPPPSTSTIGRPAMLASVIRSSPRTCRPGVTRGRSC